MTTLITTYNFMDLMKDKGHVPLPAENSFIEELENSLNSIMEFIGETAEDYDFIDLIQDKGYALSPVLSASNDNQAGLLEAS